MSNWIVSSHFQECKFLIYWCSTTDPDAKVSPKYLFIHCVSILFSWFRSGFNFLAMRNFILDALEYLRNSDELEIWSSWLQKLWYISISGYLYLYLYLPLVVKRVFQIFSRKYFLFCTELQRPFAIQNDTFCSPKQYKCLKWLVKFLLPDQFPNCHRSCSLVNRNWICSQQLLNRYQILELVFLRKFKV